MKYAWLILFYLINEIWCWVGIPPNRKNLLKIMLDVIKDTNERIGHLSDVRQTCGGRASFEIGYLMYNIQDKYRRMVDKYHTTKFMRQRLFTNEYMLLLVDVEIHYWEIEHMGNMLHEIERKYAVKDGLDQDYEAPETTTIMSSVATRPSIKWRTRSKTKKKHFNMQKYLYSKMESTITRTKKKMWPIEYGWEIDYYW